ncbi:AAA family ATPase [Treponema sp.]|uniref:AAA family ATPase n=1 Tax=Treponema sp. TaxID=166 RepID=UPI00298DFA2F|nr:AAA family ATPase [Treponema sp.]MCQ2240238.1 AAA family ATPase [Treponema sp.]
MTEIEKLENQIAELPKGYVTHRTVNKKVYYYRQGTNNGEQFSIRIPDEEVDFVSKQIELRKQLEKQLKTIAVKTTPKKIANPSLNLSTSCSTGQALRNFAEPSRKFQKRDCYETVKKYVYGETEDKVCVVYGLRRTGKTTLLKQLISEFDEEHFSKTAYIKCRTKDTIANLNKDIIQLRDTGYKYLFIDEVTLINDFIDSSSLFSDVYAAQGMKFVLSGADSLGFHFAINDELYDRAVMVHTTYIPFKEHSRLLGINDIDEYIRYGGTLKAGEIDFDSKELNAKDASFRDDESTRYYIDTAICSNIQHSLECFKDGRYFRQLKSLYEADELTNAINRIIEDLNHNFTVKVITRLFKSRDFGSAAQELRSAKNDEKRTTILDEIDTTQILETLKQILSIKEKEEQSIGITPVHIEEIKEYLKSLDLVEKVNIEQRYADNPALNSTEYYYIFTQPGMRYCQAQALIFSLLKDPQIDGLDIKLKNLITTKISEDVIGHMLEDIVMLETRKSLSKKWNNKKEAFKLQFSDGEFDMIITDSESGTCQIFEVKHSKERFEKQYQHLINKEKLELTEKIYGTIHSKTVLYKGESYMEENGVEYKNVEEYLKELY